MRKVKVELFGAKGNRTTEVKARGGMPTKHVQTPRESVPSLFGDVSLTKANETRSEGTETDTEASTTGLSELLAEVDSILYPQRKPDNPNWKPTGYHYEGYVKPKPDYDNGLYAYWNAIRQRKSDAEMDYRRERAKRKAVK